MAADILKCSETFWDKTSVLIDLVNLQRQAGQFTLSLNAARQFDTTLAAFDDWIGVGLVRRAIHEVFELSLSHPETADGCEAFSLADRWFQRSRSLALVGMESATQMRKLASEITAQRSAAPSVYLGT